MKIKFKKCILFLNNLNFLINLYILILNDKLYCLSLSDKITCLNANALICLGQVKLLKHLIYFNKNKKKKIPINFFEQF